MRAKVFLGVIATTLVTFGLIAASSLFVPPHVEAQEPPPVPAIEVQQQPPPALQAEPLLSHFATTVTPIFEGGAVGEPVRLTVEIRGNPLSTTTSWQKRLPDKVKEAIESAMREAASEDPLPDPRLDQILDKLDKIEKRLQQIERGKSRK
jgi:hypothetical protein